MTQPDLLLDTIEQRSINVIRGIAMDGPQQARSGHPGTAMALAPLAYVLWSRLMRYDAADPGWPDRDRFVLSAGHASILQYAMLHLTGYGLSRDDLVAFRQWGSRTPGHPEVHHTDGVELTTGPLGQGLATAVGLAMAERWQRARFGAEVCDHHTWVIASDGDLMEGISHEAASFAGHQGLDRLIAIYDDNRITIDGGTDLSLTDDAAARFASYGWSVLDLGDVADDIDALEAGLRSAKDLAGPTLVVLRSHIGYPSAVYTDTAAAHGSPFGDDEVAATKRRMGLPHDQTFWVPDDVAAHLAEAGRRGATDRADWSVRAAAARAADPDLEVVLGTGLRDGWRDALPTWDTGASVATRVASAACLNALAPFVPGLVSGGADLTGNTGVQLAGEAGTVIDRDHPDGHQVHYGVREHAMGAVMNGLALHDLRPVGGTFFIFSDYMRPAVRLAALGGLPVIYSWSHDSVGVGEDGPTHQPIEHLASLRAMPGLRLLRPADANETAAAWAVALADPAPTALVLSRQNLPVLAGTDAAGVARGGYVLADGEGAPDVVLVATGSEVSVAVEAAALLAEHDVATRVVSLPSWDLFAAQESAYRHAVLPPGVPTVSVEAGTTFGWERWADASVGIDRFGASAPGDVVMAQLGVTAAAVADRARSLLRDREV